MYKSKYDTREEAMKTLGLEGNFWQLPREQQDKVRLLADQFFEAQFDEKMKFKIQKMKEVCEKVGELNDQAHKLINEATSLLDEHGLSFDFSVSPLSQTYESDEESILKFFEIESLEEIEEVMDELGVSIGEYGSGWQHSAVC